MTANINLIAFGTFGNPNGFKQSFFVGNQELARNIKTFDLNTNAIKLFPNTQVFSIRKERVNGLNAIAYAVYSFAREQNSDRSGTFIGSSMLFTNEIPDVRITISQLNEFHKHLVSKNVLNDTLIVDHSDKFSVVKPNDFDKIAYHLHHLKELNFVQQTGATLVVYCNTDEQSLVYFFDKALFLLNRYDTIYFTSSNEIGEYVHQKGIFKLIQNVGNRKDFENEITNLMDDVKQKRNLVISEFERDEQRIADIRNTTLQGFKNQIHQNEIEHSENERKIREAKEALLATSSYYDAFLDATRKLTNELRQSNVAVDEVIEIHNNNKNLFNAEIGSFKTPEYVTKIKKVKSKDKIPTEKLLGVHDPNVQTTEGDNQPKTNKRFVYKIATLLLSLVLIGSWFYLGYVQSKMEAIESEQSKLKAQLLEEQAAAAERLVDLNPLSNTNLNTNDYRLLSKNIAYNTSVTDVVTIIFEKNPTEIKSYYIDQQENYAKQLVALNKQCFDDKEGVSYFVRDTLRVIPAFKK